MSCMNKKISLGYLYTVKMLRGFWSNMWNYGFDYAFYSFLWWFGFFVRTSYSYKITTYAIKKKTAWLDRYMDHNYRPILDKYRFQNNTKSNQPVEKYYVWVYWGQGENQMPPLVKACYRQLTYYNSDVKLVTNHNLSEYIDLPVEIYKRVQKGEIGWANYSDIIRNTLLARYGGLWLDATVWVSGKIPFDILQRMPLFSANSDQQEKSGRDVRFWSSFEWNWSSWCLWAREANNVFFCFVSEMLQAIALKEKIWPDYVIQDYLFYYACRYIPGVKQDMNRMIYHTPHKDSLALMMNDPFDEKRYLSMIKDNFVFKLRYRTPWQEYTPRREQTFYGRILEGII